MSAAKIRSFAPATDAISEDEFVEVSDPVAAVGQDEAPDEISDVKMEVWE